MSDGTSSERVTPAVDLRAGTDESPDIYRRLGRLLLDHGELTTSHIRAVLDQMWAREAPLGTYIEMATRRGDAVRVGDSLVATAGAVARRDTLDDPVLVALTDPEYRTWLDSLRNAARDGEAPSNTGRLGARFAPWDRRLFGERLTPATVHAALRHVLLGRRYEGIGASGDPGSDLSSTDEPFVDCIGIDGLTISFPSSLRGLTEGIGAINEKLRQVRESPAKVRMPSALDPRVLVHGGVLHPGEPLPRTFPDKHTLRLAALTRAPALSLLGALLLLHRTAGASIRIEAASDHGIHLRYRKTAAGDLLAAFAEFAASQGWVCLAPSSGGLQSTELVAVAEHLGIATWVADRLVLDEALFLATSEDPETRLTAESLGPLADRLHAWLEGLEE